MPDKWQRSRVESQAGYDGFEEQKLELKKGMATFD